MLNHLYIAEGIGGFFWIIVVIASIAGQIAKASKRTKQRQQEGNASHPPEPRRNAEPVAPEDQLQDFLRSLTGQPPQGPHPVAPVPAPVAQKPRKRQTSLKRKRQSLRQKKKALPRTHQKTAKAIVPEFCPDPTVHPAVAPPVMPIQPPMTTRRSSTGPALKRISALGALRSAIVWREILGPPVALRQTSTPQ